MNCFLEPDHKEIRHRFLKTIEPQGTDFALKYDQQKLRGVRGTVEGEPGPSSSFPPLLADRRAAGIRGDAEVGPEGDAPDAEDAVYTLTVRRKRELVDDIVEKAAKRVNEDLMSSQFAECVASLVFEKVKQFLSVGTGNRTSDGGETSTQRDDVVLTEIVERDTDDHARVETNTDARVEAASDARVEANTDARVPADTDDHALGEHDEQPVEETVDTEQDHDMAGGSAQKHQLVHYAFTPIF